MSKCEHTALNGAAGGPRILYCGWEEGGGKRSGETDAASNADL